MNEFVGLEFSFRPEGYDIDLTLTGETWLEQFFYNVDAFYYDIIAMQWFTGIIFIFSIIALQIFMNEKR